MSKRKKTSAAPPDAEPENESVTTRATVPPEVMKAAMGGGDEIRGPLQTDVGSEHDLDTGAVSVEVPVEALDLREGLKLTDALAGGGGEVLGGKLRIQLSPRSAAILR